MTRQDQRRVLGSTDVYSRKAIDNQYDRLHRRIDLYGEKISRLREQLLEIQTALQHVLAAAQGEEE